MKRLWRFILDCLEALQEEDAPKKLQFDFEKEKRRWHDYLARPPD